MPRVGRVILPNYPHHVVQLGHNRQVVFVESEDYEKGTDLFFYSKAGRGVRIRVSKINLSPFSTKTPGGLGKLWM